MHQPVQSHIEPYLSGTLAEADRKLLENHLLNCLECRTEVANFRGINDLFTVVKPIEQEASSNFYAKVLDKIEAESSNSFWNLFFAPGFLRGLAYAGISMVALSATYWFSQPRDPEDILASIQVSPPIQQAQSTVPSLADSVPVAGYSPSNGLESMGSGAQNVGFYSLPMEDPNTEVILVNLGTYGSDD
jgi:anti-sigma factor RsiW